VIKSTETRDDTVDGITAMPSMEVYWKKTCIFCISAYFVYQHKIRTMMEKAADTTIICSCTLNDVYNAFFCIVFLMYCQL